MPVRVAERPAFPAVYALDACGPPGNRNAIAFVRRGERTIGAHCYICAFGDIHYFCDALLFTRGGQKSSRKSAIVRRRLIFILLRNILILKQNENTFLRFSFYEKKTRLFFRSILHFILNFFTYHQFHYMKLWSSSGFCCRRSESLKFCSPFFLILTSRKFIFLSLNILLVIFFSSYFASQINFLDIITNFMLFRKRERYFLSTDSNVVCQSCGYIESVFARTCWNKRRYYTVTTSSRFAIFVSLILFH